MKLRLLALILSLFGLFGAKAQFVTIPDNAFVAWLNTHGYSTCMSGNQLDTTCTLIHGTSITAARVDCAYQGINDLTGIEYFRDLVQLYCQGNSLTTLPSLYSVAEINCDSNQIINIPELSQGMFRFSCRYNQLTELPSLSPSLVTLQCDYNAITTLPALPSTLQFLLCSYNQLTSIPDLPNGLRWLYCNNNSLANLPALPNRLSILYCGFNNLQGLPVLSDSLINLRCNNNIITSVPSLPNKLIDFYCSYNNISTLPPLPDSLYILRCTNNVLQSLPTLPAKLYNLGCGGNNLTQLPTLPSSLKQLFCQYNDLQYIPAIADTFEWLYCVGNPNLTCLPYIGYLNQLNFDSTSVSCIPNYGTVITSSPTLDSLPLCNGANNCNGLWSIAGKTYRDINNNCQYSTTDVNLNSLKISLNSNNQILHQTYTNSYGNFSFNENSPGIYEVEIDTTGIPFNVSCPQQQYHIDTINASDTIFYNNFALKCKNGFDLAAHSIVSPQNFRPANNSLVIIKAGDLANFYGSNCAFGVQGQVKVIISGPATYIASDSGALVPSNINGDTLLWNVANFGIVNGNTGFSIIIRPDTLAQGGQDVCFTVIVSATTVDNNPVNNILTHCFTVVNSFDPNDKSVHPASSINNGQKWLTYTVRFQNTGTAEAQHIYVMDTLDNNIDASTFELLAYSHQPNVQINENIVRFNFPFINLPDSNTHEPESHGYIQYKAKLKEGLAIGTQVKNTAYIYFDFNEPVVTNTVTNTITLNTGISGMSNHELNIQLYPNPSQNIVHINTDIDGAYSIRLYNTQGSLLSAQTVNSKQSSINLAELANGVYYAEVQDANNNIVRKRVMKM